MEVAKAAYTVKEFLRIYSIGHSKAYEEMKAGRLASRKLGTRTLIRKEDADAWLNSLPKGSETFQAPGK